jgi:hypothetical protein
VGKNSRKSKNKLNLLKKVVYSLTQPEDLFKSVRNESLSSSFLYLLFVSTISVIVIFFFGISFLGKDYVILALGEYITAILLTFIFVGMFHTFVKMFGGSSGYGETYKAYVYGFTASILFGWIPYLGILGIIYGVYSFVKGISVLHNLPSGKAFLVWFIPVLIWAVILLFLITTVDLLKQV